MKLSKPAWFAPCALVFLVAGCGDGFPTDPADRPAAAQLARGSSVVAYTWHRLPTLGGSWAVALAINDQGVAVGRSTVSGAGDHHAVLWDRGEALDLGTLGGATSVAYDISNSGYVVGSSTVSGSSWNHAFRWRKGAMEDLGTLGGLWSEATAVNERGDVVGHSSLSVDMTGEDQQHAVLWTKGEIVDLGTLGGDRSWAHGINDRGQVVGQSEDTGGDRHAFLWQNGEMLDLGTLGGDESCATDINDAGVVTGYSDTCPGCGDRRPFIYRDGRMQELEGYGGRANAISNRGIVAGASWRFYKYIRPALWTPAGIVELPGEGGPWFGEALDVNASGQAVGTTGSAVLWEPSRTK